MKQLLLLYLGLGIPYLIVRAGAMLEVLLKTIGFFGVIVAFIIVTFVTIKVMELRLGPKKIDKITEEDLDQFRKQREEIVKSIRQNRLVYQPQIQHPEKFKHRAQVSIVIALITLLNSVMIVDALMHQVFMLLIAALLIPIVTGLFYAEAVDS